MWFCTLLLYVHSQDLWIYLFSFIYLVTIAYFINTPGLNLASEDDLDYGLKIVKLQYFSLSAKFYNNTLY